ncbi:MAG: 30S ribosomal protein S16 [Deltaproteobacteria bacterium RIFCSPLOWO2_02_FULL_46_8]|nr:MAG: 30S ribosomal protein S16 [Deltaproteobacteria bacterium RIFCSPLOWO2_02_FULL_46_8]
MAVHIRFSRVGAKKQPHFRLVAAQHERSRDGRCLEVLGTYNPKLPEKKFTAKKERIEFWLNQGALPTRIVYQLLKRECGISPKRIA